MEGIPKSSILIGCSIVNRPFLGITIYENPHCNWIELDDTVYI